MNLSLLSLRGGTRIANRRDRCSRSKKLTFMHVQWRNSEFVSITEKLSSARLRNIIKENTFSRAHRLARGACALARKLQPQGEPPLAREINSCNILFPTRNASFSYRTERRYSRCNLITAQRICIPCYLISR